MAELPTFTYKIALEHFGVLKAVAKRLKGDPIFPKRLASALTPVDWEERFRDVEKALVELQHRLDVIETSSLLFQAIKKRPGPKTKK